MFDFAHVDKNIIILQEDALDYENSIGWYFDLEKLTGLIGQSYTEEELACEIKNHNEKLYNQKILQNLLSWDAIDTEKNIIKQLMIRWNS